MTWEQYWDLKQHYLIIAAVWAVILLVGGILYFVFRKD